MDENDSCSPPRVSECALAGTVGQTPPRSGAVCQIPGRSEGSYAEDFGNGPCNGDDIMVEVLGSEVYVGGVCTSESGRCSDGDAGEMYLGHGERVEDDGVISGRPANHSGDEDNGAVDGLESQDARVSGQEDGIRNERVVAEDGDAGEMYIDHGERVEDDGVISGRPANHSGDEDSGSVDGLESQNARVSRQEDGIQNEIVVAEETEKLSVVVATEELTVEKEVREDAGEGSEVARSTGGETGVDCYAGVDLITAEVVVEGQMKEMEESTGDEVILGYGDGSHERSKQDIEVLDQAALEPEIRSEDLVGLSDSQIPGEDSVMASAELGNRLASDSAEDVTKLVDGTVNASTEIKTENSSASKVAENLSDETPVREESSLEVNHNEKGDVAVVDEEVVSSPTVCVREIDVEGDRSNESVFSVPDLVWGKVKSHPWWPGQVFDFTDASEKAMKHHKKDCYLVAYFGDRTFAWNEASTLKSFQTHFSQMVAQSNGETFHNAVSCALEELSRRVELGLACSCTPKDSLDEIRFQTVENAGIRTESSRRDEVDESAGVSFFRTDKLIEFVKQLAQSPSGGGGHLGLAIAKAQLLAFSRFKGYCSLPEFQFCGELVENDTAGPCPGDDFDHRGSLPKDDEQVSSSHEIPKVQKRFSHKRKHNLRDSPYPKLKEKSMSELMGGSLDYPDEDNLFGKRRKSGDDDPTAHDGRKTTSLMKVCTPPKQSFKIGECIRRVASQLTGSPSIKGSIQKPDEYDIFLQGSEVKTTTPTEYSSLDELLLQLQYIAQDPLKACSSSKVIVNFFSDFRNSLVSLNHSSGTQLVAGEKVGAKRKKGSPETFEFDDMNDAYWTDRVIQNGVEEQQPQPQTQPQPRKYKKKDNQHSVTRPQKTPQEGRRPYNRKRHSNGDLAVTPQKPPGYISENAPAELIMNFSEVRSVPSETNLNKMFRRFGALKETETEVDREISRARVVFKKSLDAEVAFNSAGKFNIFGPTLVTYQLSYTPTLQYKPSPVIITHDHDMQLDLSAHDHEMQLDLSTHDHEMHFDLPAHDHEMHLDLSEFDVNLV